MRTLLLSSIALTLVGCSPPASDTSESGQTDASATAAAAPPETSAPTPEAAPPPADSGSGGVAQAPYNVVPANVVVHVPKSDMHAGTFSLREVARVCGEVPADHNFAGVPSFIVQLYPD